MTDLSQFSVLVALFCFGIAFLALIFMRFETRMDRLETRLDRLANELERACNRQNTLTGLSRHGLAQEFRAQRAEVAAHIAALAKGSTR
jgi:hypothetical protein